MNRTSLASDVRAASWSYIRPELGRSGRSLSENNFAKERRDWLSILLREVLQNALDARLSRDGPVTVSLKHHLLDETGKAHMRTLVPPEHLDRFMQSVPHLEDNPSKEVHSCLVVEDFGTCGLTGSLNNPELDGKNQNWNAFWFREGEGGKENTSGNGGAGQGKITYFSTSAIRTIFGYTVRADDRSQALLGASSFLRDYSYQGHKWKRDSYWGIARESDDQRIVLPVQGELQGEQVISAFRRDFGLERTSSQTGLSLIIPSPKDFSASDAMVTTIAEFFVPILRGDLVVKIDGTTLERSSIANLADQLLTDAKARELHTCSTKGYRDFLVNAIGKSVRNELVTAKPLTGASQLTEASFNPEDLASMREAIQTEKEVAVRFHVTVKSRKEGNIDCHFDVHLACPFDLANPEQAVIRRDLLIGEEPIGGGKIRQRARGLTLITDESLSRLLLTAEEATHLRWNARLPRLGEYYRSGPDVVAIVRNAMARLLEVITGGEQQRDYKLLSKYFSAPGSLSSIENKGKKAQKGKQIPAPGDIPKAKAKLLAIDALEDGCRIRPAKVNALVEVQLPIEVTVEFAYEGLDRDAFSEYDPLDFSLDDGSFSIEKSGCSVAQMRLNQLTFLIEDPNFELRVNGFDKNLRLRMRLHYEEESDAKAVDTE